MKHLLSIASALLLALLLLSSCSKEGKGSTYSVICNFDTEISTTIMVFECDDQGNKLTNHTIDDVVKGQEYSFTAIPEATRVKIYYRQETFWGTTNRWVQQVFILRNRENTSIVIDGNTIVGNKEP